MAIMIPHVPNEFTPESREGEMFESLQKLPDDYYVFHSFRIINIVDSEWKENEIDFVIFNRNKGIICLEAKAGQVRCEEGVWYYSSGKEMRDPFTQADSNKWKLNKEIQKFYRNNEILKHCKMLNAVWFPSISKKNLSGIVLPANASREIVMTAEDLSDPKDSLERIFSIQTSIREYGEMIPVESGLTNEQANSLLRNILCPSFNILPSKTLELDYKREKFNALISEQCNLLNYLEEQRSAVINGAAGTGKTMIALEKARRHSAKNEEVLFLCFNVKLKEFLEKNYNYPCVDFYTIDGFACKMCNTLTADFSGLEYCLLEMEEERSFPYRHVIVDEGQDFGQNRIEEEDILKLLEDIILLTDGGTFYVFYDKLQLVQSKHLPKFIEDADCRLTLYKNCRNTRKIAETSLKPLQTEPKLFDSAIAGTLPKIIFAESEISIALNRAIHDILDNGITNIQIISCAPAGRSSIEEYLTTNGNYPYRKTEIAFTTCRKFKGLEADAVVLIDVDYDTICDQNKLFYVGASRARLDLFIICNLSDDECAQVIEAYGSFVKKNNPKRTFAKMFGCSLIE